MATLELSIDEDVAVAAGARARRLGPLFWVASAGSSSCSRSRSSPTVLPMPSPTDMDMLERRAPFSAAALARHRRPRPRRALAADLWRADIAHRRALRAGDRPHHRRRARHAGGLFPRPVRDAGGRQHRRAAGVSAADPGAGRDRLSRAVDPQPHPASSACSAFPPSRGWRAPRR